MDTGEVKVGQRVILEGKVKAIYGPNDDVIEVGLADGRTIQTSALNLAPKLDPNTEDHGRQPDDVPPAQ